MAKKRNRLPKRIAGFKVPKAVRKSALGDFLASPAGQAVIADGLLRAGGWMLRRQAEPGSATRELAAQSGAAMQGMGAEAANNSAAVVYALRQAARAFVDAMQEDRAARAAREEEPAAARGGDGFEKKESPSPDFRTAH